MFQQSLFELKTEFSILLENRKSKTSVIAYNELKTISFFSHSSALQIMKILMDIGITFYTDYKNQPWTTTEYIDDWIGIHRTRNRKNTGH